MILAKQLGMIPSWQYDSAWAQNPKYNHNVQFPPGWNQLTVQPVGPNYGPPGLDGIRWGGRRATDCVCDSGREWCCAGATGMRGLGVSDAWASRLIVGGTILTGVAAVAALLLARK